MTDQTVYKFNSLSSSAQQIALHSAEADLNDYIYHKSEKHGVNYRCATREQVMESVSQIFYNSSGKVFKGDVILNSGRRITLDGGYRLSDKDELDEIAQ